MPDSPDRSAEPVPARPAVVDVPVDGRGRAYRGEAVTVFYDVKRCRHFAECVRGLPSVFNVEARPWIQPDAADPDMVAEVVRRCPSGALHYQLVDGEPERGDETTTVVSLPGGPLLMRGRLRLQGAGEDLWMDETRMAACACGRTDNAPFCDGACHLHPEAG